MIGKRDIEALKGLVTRLARPLVVKYATRGVLWILTTVLGLTAAASETTAGEIGFALATIATAAISLAIDRWHHKMDMAEGRPKADQPAG